jgi:hypothetical protein
MTKQEVHQRISLRQFARDSGRYHYRTVARVVAAYAGTGKKPRTVLACEILEDLSKKMGEQV